MGVLWFLRQWVYDIDKDGLDEAILNINDYECTTEILNSIPNPPEMTYQLIAIDFQSRSHQVIDYIEGFRSPSRFTVVSGDECQTH